MVRSKLPPTPHSSTSKLVHPEVTRHAPPRWQESTPKSRDRKILSCALLFPLSAKAYQYFDPNQLPHFLIFTRVQNRTHDLVRAPETPCRLAYSTVFSPCSRGRGAARSAPKARAIRWEKPRSESCTDPARSSIEHLRGEVGVGGFIPICHEESGGDGSLPGPNTRLH